MNLEQFKDNLQAILGLEWLGIRIEDVKEEMGDSLFDIKIIYYYSVPESSNIESDNEELNVRIKTADGLKRLGKEMLVDMIINACKSEYPDDEEFIEDVESNISDFFQFRAKVRKGEIWTKEMGDNRVKELCGEIQQASQYSEV